MSEPLIRGFRNRILQECARVMPSSLRVHLHRWRGADIGQNVWIGYDCVIETSRPDLIRIGRNVVLSVRVVLIAHFHGVEGITIEDDVFVGPGAIILPNVTIGQGAVVTAGSVVSSSVPARTMVQGNPARPIALCGISLASYRPLKEFYQALRPIRRRPNTG